MYLLVNAVLSVFLKRLLIAPLSFVWHRLVKKERKLSFLLVNAALSVFLISHPSIVQLSSVCYQFAKKERYWLFLLGSAVLSVLQSVALSQSLDLARLLSVSSFTILPQTSVSYSSMEDVEEMIIDLTHDQNAFLHVVSPYYQDKAN